MKTALFTGLAIACCVLICPATTLAQDTANRVTVTGVHNEVELPYLGFLRSVAKLNTQLPPEPRHIDLLNRILFIKLDPVEQDQFVSPTWAISIVSPSRDIEVPIVRGGYFVLPIDQVAMKEKANIIFNTHTQDKVLGLVVQLRTHPDEVIRAADLAAALNEATQFQDKAVKTNLYHTTGHVNAIKACFGTSSGDMIIAHGAGSKTSLGTCKLYIPADSDVETNAEIAFNTKPDIVVLVPASRT